MLKANDSLALRYAKRHVRHYRDEQEKIMAEHREAMDCFDCEAFLQLGIDAFTWLTKADTVIHQAIYKGLYEYDPEVDAALEEMYRGWLKPCDDAEKWIAIQYKRGYTVSNLEEFRRCCDEVRAIVKSFDAGARNTNMSDPLIVLRDQALQEHSNGQTAEFF